MIIKKFLSDTKQNTLYIKRVYLQIMATANKRGQNAASAAVLLALVMGLIIAFIILIPPEDRAELLDEPYTSSSGSSSSSSSNGDVDLVLTDHFMPVMDGLELTRRIRADSKYASLPVIMCSGGGTTCREEALVAGADNFLEKPYAAKPLLELIATYLQ